MQSNIKNETFAEILNGDKPVLVDFSATWCGPCKMMKPVLEDLHRRKGDTLRILKVDIDKSPSAANAFNVQSVPTLFLFQKGKQLWRQSGALSINQLEEITNKYIA